MNLVRGVDVAERVDVVEYDPRFATLEEWLTAGVRAEIARYDSARHLELARAGRALPDSISRFGYFDLAEGLLVNNGGNYFAKKLRETSAAAGGNPDTTVHYNSANALIGIGDSTTAAAVGQTDLQAATNKVRVGMTQDIGAPASFPKIQGETYFQVTDTTAATGVVGQRAIVFSALVGSSVANFAWNEFAVFNTNTAGSGMLDRFVSAQSTKVSPQVWQIWIIFTLS